jgi:hypothetical protein
MTVRFTLEGHLPPGDLEMTISALRSSLFVSGGAQSDPAWDRVWRAHLVENLAILFSHLQRVGITEVFADGSFASEKARPGDIDGYFLCEYTEFSAVQLPKLIAQDIAWDHRQRSPDRYGKMKPLMWHRFQVELFPQFMPPYQFLSPATSRAGRLVLFPEFFRRTRTGTSRGIIRLIPEPTT